MKLKDCERCLVYGTDNKPLARARVEVSSSGEVLFYFSTSKLRSVRFKTIADLYDGAQGVIRCQCELTIQRNMGPTKLNEPWMAVCDIRKVNEVFQRQKDLRAPTQIRAEFRGANGLLFFGVIQNISAGGLFLATPQSLKKNDRLIFAYNFGAGLYNMQIRVLRVAGPVQGGIGYGCQFIDLPLEAETAIRKFVFTKQQEKQQKKQLNP